jgi:hypothetical protein
VELLLDRAGPALREVLAEQVHDRVAPAQGVGWWGSGLWIGPRTGLYAEGGRRSLGVARERRDLVPAPRELPHERTTDGSCGSGNRDAHQRIAACSTVGCSGSGSPERPATSATALATARLTSRLNTLGMM